MHLPGRELNAVTEEYLEEFHFDKPVDSEKFISEYKGMLQLFRDHGTEVLLLHDILHDDPDALNYMAHRPNMTYTRDLASVFSSGAVLMSPHLIGRKGDQEMLGRAFRKLGVPVLGSIEPPGYLEGGGVTIIGDDTAVASLCDRANEFGTRALRDLILGKDVRFFLEVPLPRGHIHIDGLFMVLDQDLALIYPEVFRVFPCRLYESGKMDFKHVMFEDFLDQRGIRTIPITKEERREGHLNVVVTKRSHSAVGFDKAHRVKGVLREYGWQLDMCHADEMYAGNGGPHCMTCPILVD